MSSSADEDNTQCVWNGVDERNLSLLFWNTENDATSSRLVSLLRIQAEAEKLSKKRKRKRLYGSRRTFEAGTNRYQDDEGMLG